MLGAPPAKPDDDLFQNRIVKAILDLLINIVVGAVLGVACALLLFLLAALFGDIAGVTGEHELSPRVAVKMFGPSLAAAKAGAINFTLARYILLSKTKLKGVVPILLAAASVGGLVGLGFSEGLGGKTPLVTAEWFAVIAFWLTSMTVGRRDDNLGRDYLYYPRRGGRFP
jgi:hypothetical protein